MSSPIFFRPAIPLLISLMIGILLGSEYSGFKYGGETVVIVSVACILGHIYRRQNGIIFPVLLFLALGYLSIAPWVQPKFPANHIVHFAGSTRWEITGTIDGRPQHYNNRFRFVLRGVSLADAHQTHTVCGKLRVTAMGQIPPLAAGDAIQFQSRVRLISNFNNPGGFDYKRYLAFKGIWATAYLSGDRLAVQNRQPSANIFNTIDSIRRAFSNLVEQFGNADSRAVLKALIIGERHLIRPELRQAFNRAGAGHLLAISGLHIGIVATVAFTFFQFMTKRFNPLLWRAWGRKCAALLTLLPVLIYGLTAGFSPSTQRAVIMVAVFLLTFLFESEQDPLNTLSLAALLILVIDPPSLFSVSFQLSFTAVLGIVYGLSRLNYFGKGQQAAVTKDRLNRFKKLVFSFLLVSFLAICGSLPLVAFYFNQISLIGLATNLVVIPLIGFIAVPLGLAALLVLPISVTLASWLIEADLFILSYALPLVKFFADLPFAAVKIVTPSPLEIACFYIMGWALLNLGRSHSMPNGLPPVSGREISGSNSIPSSLTPASRKSFVRHYINLLQVFHLNFQRTRFRAKIALSLVSLILVLDTGYWLYQRFWHRDLKVTVIDVGHGSAALLEFPGGHTILIDGGGFSDNSTFDIGEKIIAPFLWRKKIQTVDTIVLSHPNSDHLNGLIFIARYFNVKNVWTNNEPYPTEGYARFMDVIASRKISLEKFESMSRRHCIDDIELKLLYPPPDYLNLIQSQKWRNTNNNSLVVKVSLKSVSFLFPGDIMAQAENELVHLAGDRLASTVLIAPHHGSRTSSSLEFINAVNPRVTVISSGARGRFKLPHPSVLKRYRDHGCRIWQTSVNGAVQFSTDGRTLEVKPFLGDTLPGSTDYIYK